MAPTSPVKRVTRARAAAKSSTEDTAPKKLGTTKVAKSTTTKTAATKAAATKATTRKTRTKDEVEEEVVEAEPTKKTTRTTTKAAAPLPAAPRRRVKVTPLDAPAAEEPVPEPEPEKPKRKTTTRTKKAAEPEPELEHAEEEPAAATSTRARTTRTAAAKPPPKKTASKTTKSEPAAPKTRGRPKKSEQPEEPEPEPVKTTRQTRARSGSTVSQQPDAIEVAPKPRVGTRKKVTFQDVSEDEKENEPVAPRRAAAKKATAATGLRAKPVRKPAATTTKKAAATRSRITKAEPRALTPKKISQVQRTVSPEDSEDELSGAKTPVRDLSLSPKRNANLAAQLSPAKKLDFTQTLKAKSPERLADHAALLSPARRPTSPAKAPTVQSPAKGSPKRVDIFPSDTQETVATALTAPTLPGLQQSPRRGVIDSTIFSHSAIKAKRSPLKESLLQSPARRLFSPAKQRTPLSVHRDTENEDPSQGMETVEEITVSSHFRASMSPQRAGRVHRMSDEELADELAMDTDFDQSVLKMTSPKKSPIKIFKPVISEALNEEPQMQVIQNDVEETARAVEELQELEETQQSEDEIEVEQELTIEPAQVSLSATDESTEESEKEERVVRPTLSGRGKAPRISQILFRTNRSSEEEESEDELAADQTPDRAPRLFRSSMTGNNTRSRLSMGIQPSANRNVGFTPLAAQMSGWLANSPDKNTPSKGLFSPAAAQHVAGEIQISRQSTPQQHKASPMMRSSVTSRPSMTASALGSPEKSSFFAEQMSAMDNGVGDEITIADEMTGVETEADDLTTGTVVAAENAALFEELQHADEPSGVEGDEEDTTVIINKPVEELTTDLVNQTHASDTAMVDFQNLAQEAENMADANETATETSSEYGDENAGPEETLNLTVMEREMTPEEQTLNLHVMEQEAADNTTVMDTPIARPVVAADEPTLNLHVLEENATARSVSSTPVAKSYESIEEPTLNLDVLEKNAAPTPVARAHVSLDEPTLDLQVLEQNALVRTPGTAQSVRVAERAITPDGSPEPTASPLKAVLVEDTDDMATPVGRIFSGPRVFNTVVSKVPLKPEGEESPIKIPKKRSRSMSMSKQQSPPKRPQLTPIGKLAARSTSAPVLSPSRSVRSAAPSPAHTTPGQMSFMVDDFGDSTLDGIELPDDEMDFDVGRPAATPSTIKSSKTVRSVAPTPARAPLGAVGEGVLHGAVVYVEVHTSEGADASGVYIDLLSQMGAKCIKDWRWNPRTSVHAGDDLAAASKIGITHVVYKDGGKRTLEKVRDAKGEVWCVGVRWVLE